MRRASTGLFAACALVAAMSSGRAADLGGYRPFTAVPPAGLACEDPAVKAFPSVWLGHFSGGFSHYVGPGSVIVVDWRDEKLCFPDRRTCGRYIAEMRHDFHRPEGEYTCLPIR
jgi:hypothetical protein